jgi:hypothetical protein
MECYVFHGKFFLDKGDKMFCLFHKWSDWEIHDSPENECRINWKRTCSKCKKRQTKWVHFDHKWDKWRALGKIYQRRKCIRCGFAEDKLI